MSDGDWHDPFAENEAAREREARRRAREERRRQRRHQLGDKVREGLARTLPPSAGGPAGGPPEGPPRPPSDEAPAAPAKAPPPPRRPAASRSLLVRRIVGVVAVFALAALLVVGVVRLADAIGGEDEPAAAPPKRAKVENLTIPEGLDRRQIAELAKEAGLRGDYVEATKKFNGFDPQKYGAEDPPNLDGFLFPATYELERNASVEDLVAKQLEAFRQNLRGVDLSYAKSKNLNVYDVLKIASMVEREVMVDKERRLVAAVIYNRLAAGDTLGIDATIRYYLRNYDEQLTESELVDPHPYNTRLVPGLPPTPIGNPGLASIEAAADPARSDVYYFVVKPGTCGEHVFVETAEEHAEAEAEYQAALEAEGGSPTEC